MGADQPQRLSDERIVAIRQSCADFGRGSRAPWSDTIGFARAIEAEVRAAAPDVPLNRGPDGRPSAQWRQAQETAFYKQWRERGTITDPDNVRWALIGWMDCAEQRDAATQEDRRHG